MARRVVVASGSNPAFAELGTLAKDSVTGSTPGTSPIGANGVEADGSSCRVGVTV